MNTENIEAIAENPAVQATTAAGTIGAAHVDKMPWYDGVWSPIWNVLPWDQLATVIGTCVLTYSAYVTIKNAVKNKNQ